MTTYPIAIIGGTGPRGKGLAYRLAQAGHSMVLGSRSEDRATVAVDGLSSGIAGAGAVTGATKLDAASNTEITVLAIPHDGHDELVESLGAALHGKSVVNCVNPLGFAKRGQSRRPSAPGAPRSSHR
jgi:predicted dinucleotide-binding enzyme